MISIIVPVYNTEAFLDDCIVSILQQTYSDFEVILIDDGSTDNSPMICDKWQKSDNRISVFHKKNGGLSSARNYGLKKSNGEYITFIDSDDLVHQQYLEILLDSMKKINSDISAIDTLNFKYNDELNYKTYDMSNTQIKTYSKYDVLSLLGFGNDGKFVISCAKLYKRQLFDNTQFNNGRYHEDEYIIHRIMYQANLISFCELPLYFYRNNINSITRSQITDKRFMDKIDAYEDRLLFYKENNECDLYKKSIIIYLNKITYFTNKYKNQINKNTIKYAKKKFKKYFSTAKQIKIVNINSHTELYIYNAPYLHFAYSLTTRFIRYIKKNSLIICQCNFNE